jgi:hypothetical protein
MSRIFIDRPIFAWVIAIITMMIGVGAVLPARAAVPRYCPAAGEHQRHLSGRQPPRWKAA